MKFRLNSLRAGWIAFVMLAACGCSAFGQNPGSSAPQIQIVPQTPADVVGAFLTAWSERNYDAMYALLSSESQSLNSASVFRALYEDADSKIGTSAVQYTIYETEIQGLSAVVSYDVVIESTVFGAIEDVNRRMRLVQTPAGWRVAWTTMDIFDGYAAGTTLNAVSRRPPRGNIYDRSGVPLVEQDSTVIELYVMRQEIPNEEACLTLLADVLNRQRSDLATFFARFDVGTIFGFGDIDPDEFARWSDQLSEICSIRTDSRQTRRYAGHGTAAHITGYIGQMSAEEQAEYVQRGYGPGDLIGKAGIEAQYEEELAGAANRLLQITEPGGLVVRELAGAEGEAPQSVWLTVDARLQEAAGQALADAFNYAEPNWGNRAHSTGGGLVVLDINTGAVLALASYPSYDPGIFNPDTSIFLVGDYILSLGADVRQPFINRVTQLQYPPGSTFKIITTAAAAEERVWRPDEIFYCGRVWQGQIFGDSRTERYDWRNFEPEDFNFDTGEVNMAEALAASCNPFFYQMGALLFREAGPTVLTDYARRMGLGRPTGIDLIPQEAGGQIVPPTGTDAAISTAIGQYETQVTILQMARLVAGIANGGTLYRPYIVERVGRDDGTVTYQGEPTAVGDMGLSESTLEIVRQGMCMVTDSSVYGRTSGERLGTAWFVFSDPDNFPAPYTVCGKTGTSQTGRIEPMGWFVAYAPAENPQIAIAAMIEYSREGSETAAPIVRRVLDAYFNNPNPAPFPEWWTREYIPLNIPEGSTGV